MLMLLFKFYELDVFAFTLLFYAANTAAGGGGSRGATMKTENKNQQILLLGKMCNVCVHVQCTVLVYFLWFSLLLYLITNRPRMLVQISFKIYVYSFLYDSIRRVNCGMLNRAWAIWIVFLLLGHHNKLSILFSFTCKLLPFVFILMALFAFQRRVFCFSVFCFLLQINHRRNNNWFLEWVEWVERVEWGSTEQQHTNTLARLFKAGSAELFADSGETKIITKTVALCCYLRNVCDGKRMPLCGKCILFKKEWWKQRARLRKRKRDGTNEKWKWN